MEDLQSKFLTNKITVRWLAILNVLERNRTCTVQHIADVTNLSQRTVVKEIKDIREYFQDTIELKTNNLGYFFSEVNFEKYIDIKRQMVREDPLFIILQSILEGTYMTVEDWSFNFHLSESTMKRNLLSVTSVLSEYDLKLSMTPVNLIGDEVNVRKFFKDFYYGTSVTPHILLPFSEMNEFISYLEKERMKLKTDISSLDFKYFLYIAIQRSKQGKGINGVTNHLDYTNEEQIFLSALKSKIWEIYNHEISDDELTVIYIYGLTKRKITTLEPEIIYCNRFSQGINVEILSKKFISKYDINLLSAEIDITYFIASFFVSIRWLDSIGDIMNKSISNLIHIVRNRFPEEYERTFGFLKTTQKALGFESKYLKDISANLVLLTEAIKDMHLRNPRKIAFLIEESHFIKQAIQAKAYRYLKGYHQIFFPNIGDLTQSYIDNNQIDIFVTTQEEYVEEWGKGIDFVLFKSMPDKDDWSKLLTVINPRITKDFTIEKAIRFEI